MKCPICSKEIKDYSKFCEYCGQKIPRCPTCGSVVPKKMRFCVYDGTELSPELFSPLMNANESARPIQQVTVEETVKTTRTVSPEFMYEAQQLQMPKKKSKKPWIILLILLLVTGLGVGGFFVWKCFIQKLFQEKPRIDSTIEESKNQEEEEDDFASEDRNDQEEEEAKNEPEEVVTEEPTAKKVVHEYEIISSDMSWENAKKACEASGGYLATITSQEEYEEICELASQTGLTYLWIGGYLDEAWDDWADCQWITGESWSFENWYPGEPSMVDEDGTKESYLCLWNAKYDGQSIGWTFNDQRNDIVDKFPSFSGKVGYICEYEIEVEE